MTTTEPDLDRGTYLDTLPPDVRDVLERIVRHVAGLSIEEKCALFVGAAQWAGYIAVNGSEEEVAGAEAYIELGQLAGRLNLEANPETKETTK